jgi:hypothetical protein
LAGPVHEAILTAGPLLDDLGLEAGISIARRLNADLAEVAADDLRVVSISAVAGAMALGIMLVIAEVFGHFDFQQGFKGGLHQALDEVLPADHGGSSGGLDVLDKLLSELLGIER